MTKCDSDKCSLTLDLNPQSDQQLKEESHVTVIWILKHQKEAGDDNELICDDHELQV